MPAYVFTVLDAATASPIEGAYILLACRFDGGTIPFDGHTNSDGKATINTLDFACLSWYISKSNYESQSGTSPSTYTTVYLIPIVVTFTLTIVAAVGGTTDPAPGSYQYESGSEVFISANPQDGYEFDYWLINGVKTLARQFWLTIDQNIEMTAYFTTITVPPTPPPDYTPIVVVAAASLMLVIVGGIAYYYLVM